MGSESIASCPHPSLASPESPSPVKAKTLQNTLDRSPNKGACFHCNEEGHWVRDCPRRSNPSPGSGSPTPNRRSHPELQCPCGYGPCIVLTSRTSKNPGRDFYRCPAKQSEQCGFFKWCDEAAYGQIPKYKSPMKIYQQHDGTNSPMKPACQIGLKRPVKREMQFNDADLSNPVCSCGAGKCIILTVADGENSGRKYFACPIKKGQGACNHFQWYDSTTKPMETKHSDGLPEKAKLPILGNLEPDKAINISKADDLVVPVSPLLQDPLLPRASEASVKEREAINAFLQFSPPKSLSLHEGSQGSGGSKHVRCLKLGGEVQRSNESNASPSAVCFRCGRVGPSKHNCPA